MDSKIENKDSKKSCDKSKKDSGNKNRKGVESRKSSKDSSGKSTPISDLDRKGSPTFSEDSHQSDCDFTDSKLTRRRSSPKQVHVVSLNLKSKNNPLNPEKILEGILPGGKPKILGGEAGQSSKDKEAEIPKPGGGNSDIEKPSSKTNSSKTIPTIDEEFRQKIKRMDYNTVYMMAQRTKGPQQYKYRKILQEMYDEQNK